MNAPATAAAIAAPAAAPTLQFVPIAMLRPSRTHIQALRRQRFDRKTLEELAESIKKVGILQPLVGRPVYRSPVLNHLPDDPTHEIVAGERRFLAAKLAGLATVPVNVAKLTDEQVLEIQLIENLQREGLHELEEAEGYEELMKLKDINADALAELVGKSRSYVYARTKLLALCPEARKAFYAGAIDASKALLVARIGHPDTQRQALKDLTGTDHWGGTISYKQALRHIQQHYMLELAKAPFPTGDATLVAQAGTCAACPKRTGNQRELFADVKSADVCTDPKCFADKKAAHQARLRSEAQAKGATVIVGEQAKKIKPHEYSDTLKGYRALDATVYEDRKNRTVRQLLGKAAPPPAFLEDAHAGKLVPVVKEEDFAKALKTQGIKLRDGGRYTASAEQKARERKARRETEARGRILAAVRLKVPAELAKPELQLIALAFFDRTWHENQKRLLQLWGFEGKPHDYKAEKAFATLTDKDLALRLVDMALIGDVHVGSYSSATRNDALHAVAKRYRVDVDKIYKAVKAETDGKAKPAPMDLAGEAGFKPAAGLARIVGIHPLTKPEVLKRVQAYIASEGLQKDKHIQLDAKLKTALGKSVPRIGTFELASMVNERLTLAVSASPKAKKAKR